MLSVFVGDYGHITVFQVPRGERSHTPLARMLPRVVGGLSNKIVGSQNHGSVGLGLLLEELTRCSLFNNFAQPHKLIYPIWPHVTPTFKIVHRRSADRAQNYFTLIEHRELNDGPIEVVTPDLALLQRHCKCSIPEGFQCAMSIGRCQFSSEAARVLPSWRLPHRACPIARQNTTPAPNRRQLPRHGNLNAHGGFIS